MAAHRRDAPDLGRHELGVPDGGDRQRDEASRVGAAPALDVPVVVGPQHVDGEALVLGPGEELPAELDEGGEAHRPEHPVGVHVAHPLVDVVAAGAHLLEGGGFDAVLLGGPTHHGVEADVGDEVALERPHVGAVGVVDDLGGAVLPLGRHPALEHVGGLDDMVVDAHEDEIFGLHRAPPQGVPVRVRIIYLTSVSGTRWAPVLHCAPMHADAPRGLAGVARVDPERVALVLGDRRMTFGELDGAANAVAHAFAPTQAHPGDRVAVMMGNSTDAFAVWHGVTRLGALVVPVSTRLTESEVAYIVEDSGARLLAHDGSPVAAATRGSGRRARRSCTSRNWPRPWPRAGPGAPTEEFLGTPVVAMTYTSGTTGRPKGITPAPPPPRRARRRPTPLRRSGASAPTTCTSCSNT